MSKKCKNECKKTSIGGQALIEGIMMRGPKMTAMAVRDPKGKMILEKWKTQEKPAPKVAKLPVIRGVYAFISSMITGYKSLMRSAEISGLEAAEEEMRREKEAKKEAKRAKRLAKRQGAGEEAQAPAAAPLEAQAAAEAVTENVPEAGPHSEKKSAKKDKKESSALTTGIMLIASVLGVALSVGLFIALPVLVYGWCSPLLPESITGNDILNSFVKSVFEGVLRIIVLVAYMLLVSLMKDIRRTFKYHGAEHKTIFCYEHGNKLTVENVRKERRFHPRCGTSFLILMLIVGIFVSFFIDPVFLIVTKNPALLETTKYVIIRVGVKLLLTPFIMGLGYELIKFAGKRDNIITKIISAPGVWLQHVTVLEPDDDMIECAIAAFVEVMPEEEREMYVEKEDIEVNNESCVDSGDVLGECGIEENGSENTAQNASPEITTDGSEE